ncbi:MAG: nuclease [Gammaproteobacteria bacterium]|nr:nuclease [Gammaproteobacteria bacterium]
MSPIEFRADDRERGSGVIEEWQSRTDVIVTVERLPLGDYAVDNLLLFERKTLPDLAASIKDGRVFQQACRLAASSVRGVLILEGVSADLAKSGMRREAIQGTLIHITLFLGIPLLRAKNPQESAHLMLYAARQARAFTDQAATARHFPGKRPRGKRKTQLHLLQGLPGIGPERARILLDAFGSVEAVFKANASELQYASGIGDKTAREIRWAVSE